MQKGYEMKMTMKCLKLAILKHSRDVPFSPKESVTNLYATLQNVVSNL